MFQNKLHITNCCLFYDFYHNAHPQRPANAFTLCKSKTGCQSIKVEQKVLCQETTQQSSFNPDIQILSLTCLLSITSRHNNRLHSFTTVLETEVTLFSVYQVLKFQSMEYFTQLPAKETDPKLRPSNLSSFSSINKFLCS